MVAAKLQQAWREPFCDKKLIIWGASRGGKQAAKFLKKNGFHPYAWCDNDQKKHGKLLDGSPVFSPASLIGEIAHEGPGRHIIIIASYAFGDIFDQIKRLDVKAPVYVYYLYDPCHLKSGKNFIKADKEQIRGLYAEDAYTSELLDHILEKGFLNSEQFGHIDDCLKFSGVEAYFYDPVTAALAMGNGDNALTLLDVGSYDGKSILQINGALKGHIHKTYGFEPNENNYQSLSVANIPNLALYKMALGDINGYMGFCEEGPFFRMSENAGDANLYRVARLDDLDIAPSGKCILKIDVEGAEMRCLRGAQEFIKKYRPAIAVCVYHKEEDILAIPAFLKELVPDYRFLLRGGMHTVCYAFA